MQKKCPISNEYIVEDDEACDKFELPSYFWCRKDSNWIAYVACISRQERKKEGCQRCKQSKTISYLWDKYGIKN